MVNNHHASDHINNNNKFFDQILSREQSTKLKEMFKRFKENKKMEFEVSFRDIDYSNYMRIVEHYVDITDEKNISSEDSLDISVTLADKSLSRYRVRLLDKTGIDDFVSKFSQASARQVTKYLVNLNTNETTEIMIKNRESTDSLYLEDLNAVFRISSEELIKKSSQKPNLTGNEKIVYRYKQRVSFLLDEGRLDLSEIKQASNLFQLNSVYSRYEIEMEAFSKTTLERFLNETYQILLIIQDADIAIGRSEAATVLEEYRNLLRVKSASHLESRYVISLEIYHLVTYLPNKYAVTDKADGERYFLFTLPEGTYLLSQNLGVKKISVDIKDEKYHYLLLDGELVKNEKGKMFLAFDVVYAFGKDYRQQEKATLTDRLSLLNNIIDKCFDTLIPFTDYATNNDDMELNKIRQYYHQELKKYWKGFDKLLGNYQNKLIVTRKLYFVPYGIDPSETFMYADMVWKLYVYNKLTPYKLDGIIYTPINAPYLIKADLENLDSRPVEYKWKKASLNSIDFYIEFEKDAHGSEAIFYDNAVRQDIGRAYKICSLFVGIVKGGQEKPVPFKVQGVEQKANIYLVDGEARNSEGKVIDDQTVVEFIYDNSKVDVPEPYRWIPLRTRYDKTESVHKYGKKYGNYLHIALRIWRSIVNPITEESIAALADPQTYQKEMNRLSTSIPLAQKENIIYYQKKTSQARGMRSFNNWIKSSLIHTYCLGKESVLDIGCGRGGDLLKFIFAGIQEYVGVDIDNNGLYLINDSAYNRYQSLAKKHRNVPPMYFIHADARGLFNVEAQESILPKMTWENKNLIKTWLSGKKKYDVVNCQFSIHYYLSDDLSWSNFCHNINNHLKDNGYFLVTTFDGKLVYDKLWKKSKLTISYTDNVGRKINFFEIVKIYTDQEENANLIGPGMAIDVYNSLISVERIYHREYLVFPEFLKQSLREKCGLELVESDSFLNLFNLYYHYFSQKNVSDFADLGISPKRFNEIRDFYLMLQPQFADSYRPEDIEANSASFKLAMLNRYYVFKKTRNINFQEPARVVGINHNLNLGRIITPYLIDHRMIIDPTKKTSKVNKLYHAIRKANSRIRPDVYLIRHSIPEKIVDDETYRWNQFHFVKLKNGDSDKIFLVYKSPEKIYYPIYYQSPKGNKYLLDSHQIVKDLDLLVKLTEEWKRLEKI